jgi:hypothetical protein
VSQVVSRRHRRRDLRIDPIWHCSPGTTHIKHERTFHCGSITRGRTEPGSPSRMLGLATGWAHRGAVGAAGPYSAHFTQHDALVHALG